MQLDFFYHNRTPSYASMSTISGHVHNYAADFKNTNTNIEAVLHEFILAGMEAHAAPSSISILLLHFTLLPRMHSLTKDSKKHSCMHIAQYYQVTRVIRIFAKKPDDRQSNHFKINLILVSFIYA